MEKQQEDILANLLLTEGFCSCVEESRVFAEAICTDSANLESETIERSVQEILDVTAAEAKDLANKLQSNDEEDSVSVGDTENQNDLINEGSDDEDHEAETLFDGECELCDRYIRLTKHHLIPKSSRQRTYTRLLDAAEAKEKGNLDKAMALLGPGLERVMESLSTDKSVIREILHETCNICRPCHTAVHKAHSNVDLALHYNSIEFLLKDEHICKYCKWASKQKPGSYAVLH